MAKEETKALTKKEVWQTVKWSDADKLDNMAKFNQFIDRKPQDKHVKTNKYSQNAKYLPIRVVESLLKMVYPAHQIEMTSKPEVIGNSIVVGARVRVLHPVLGEWLNYDGVGAVPIEISHEGAGPLDFNNINPKGLHKNVPAALSFAVSNAAKKIGPLFGSQLNSPEDEVLPVVNMYQQTSER